jgi:hypothetical protein
VFSVSRDISYFKPAQYSLRNDYPVRAFQSRRRQGSFCLPERLHGLIWLCHPSDGMLGRGENRQGAGETDEAIKRLQRKVVELREANKPQIWEIAEIQEATSWVKMTIALLHRTPMNRAVHFPLGFHLQSLEEVKRRQIREKERKDWKNNRSMNDLDLASVIGCSRT